MHMDEGVVKSMKSSERHKQNIISMEVFVPLPYLVIGVILCDHQC